VERSIYRWGDPVQPVNDVIIDPFQSPFPDQSIDIANAPSSDANHEPAQNLQFSERIEQIERQLLWQALTENGHNQRRTAKALGLSYDQLRGMVRKYKLTNRERQA
jgi:psp operon transcriptional activator